MTTTEPREHVVQGIFVPVGFVLWTALCGVCLLRRDLAAHFGSLDLLMPGRSPATLQPAAKTQDAARSD